jgi:hypothetical protein
MKMHKAFKPETIATRDQTRDSLTAPHLDGDYLRATDGKMMVYVPVEREKGDVDGHVPVSAFKPARQAVRKRRREMENYELTVALPLQSAVVRDYREGTALVVKRPHHLQFPKRENTDGFFSQDDTLDVGINAALLLQVVKALGSDRGQCVLRFRKDANGNLDAQAPIEVSAIYTFAYGPEKPDKDGHGVIMPVRITDKDGKAWRKVHPAKAAK